MGRFSLREITAMEMDQYMITQGERSFTQNSCNAHLDELLGRRVVFLALYENNQIVAAGKFSLRKVLRHFYVATSILGPVLDYYDSEIVSAFFEETKKYLKKNKVIHLTILPRVEMGRRDADGSVLEDADWSLVNNLERAGLNYQGKINDYHGVLQRWFLFKDIDHISSDEELVQTYDAKTRNQIRKARRNNIYLREISREDLPTFNKIMESTAERRDFNNRTEEYYQKFIDSYGEQVMTVLAYLDPNASIQKQKELADKTEKQMAEIAEKIDNGEGNKKKLKGQWKELENQLNSYHNMIKKFAEYDDGQGERAISGAMFVTFNGEMTYLYSGTIDKYLDLNASHLIQDYAQKKAVDLKCQTYNYFGTLGEYCGEDGGIYHFKKGFGGRVVELPGAFTMNIHPIWGRLYEWKNN